MRRPPSRRRRPTALLAALLALALGACGSSAVPALGAGARRRDQGAGRSANPRNGAAERRQTRRHADRAQPRGLRTPRSRPGLLLDRLPGRLRDPAAALLVQAEHLLRRPARTSPPGRRRSPPIGKTVTVHIRRRSLQPAGQPRSDLRRRRLRDRARRQPERRQPLLHALLRLARRPSEAEKKADGGPIPGITTPNRTRSSFT